MIKLGNLTVSDEDLAVIAHVVHNETPEEWATRAYHYPKGGEAAVRAKIARYRDSYLAAKDDPEYKPAAERMSDRDAFDQAAIERMRTDDEARKAAEDKALDDKIAAEVARQLAVP